MFESGLRLLHPMMPFLSEELYQKFPDFEGKGTSICVNEYPVENKEHDNPTLENDFNIINSISKTIRSLTSSINLPKSANPACYAIIIGETAAELNELISS